MGNATKLLLLLLLYTLPTGVHSADPHNIGASSCASKQAIEFRGFTARLENDLFAQTDKNYTNGVALTAISQDITGRPDPGCLPLPVGLFARLIGLIDPEFWGESKSSAQSRNVVVKVGQSMYTPEDPFDTNLITSDRPYAGLLYVGTSWNRRMHNLQDNSDLLDTRELTLGVIGPWSLAEQAQNLVHDTFGSDRFLGWQHQLRNEPAVQLALDRKKKMSYRGAAVIVPGFSTDWVNSVGLRLGNIETSVILGSEARIGWNLPNDFGSYSIRPGAENRPPSASPVNNKINHGSVVVTEHSERGRAPVTVVPRPGIHLFGSVEAKLVAWDFSLDGNLFRSSHHVTRRPWVAQAAFGLSMQGLMNGRGYRLALMRVFRLREFEEQESNHVYGSVAFSVEF